MGLGVYLYLEIAAREAAGSRFKIWVILMPVYALIGKIGILLVFILGGAACLYIAYDKKTA
jgi:hypothetical protein